MKISARNTLKGTVTDIKEGVVTAVVTVDIGGGNQVVSSITMESVKSLGLAKGAEVTAVIKASNVMLAVE